MFRSKVKWIEYVEKRPKFVLDGERDYNRKVIAELKRSGRKTVVSEKEIRNEIQVFTRRYINRM